MAWGASCAREVPLLVLFGERSDSLGITLSGTIASKLKQGRVEKIADTGHFMPMEKPADIARMAVDFLGSRPNPQPSLLSRLPLGKGRGKETASFRVR